MAVRIKVIQQSMPVVGNTLRFISTYSDFDSDRTISDFFTCFLPQLTSNIAEDVILPNEGICQTKLVITIDYGDKDISDIRNEVEK